jgi:hypothetical protein
MRATVWSPAGAIIAASDAEVVENASGGLATFEHRGDDEVGAADPIKPCLPPKAATW